MLMFTYEACTILTVEFTLIVIAIKSFIEIIKNRKTKQVKKKQEKNNTNSFLFMRNKYYNINNY